MVITVYKLPVIVTVNPRYTCALICQSVSMQNANKEIILDSDVRIPRGGSGNRLLVIGVGYYLKVYTIGRQLPCKTSSHSFVEKRVVEGF